MKQLTAIFCLAGLLTAAPVLAHEAHGKPMHGGVVAEAGHAQFEIVEQAGQLTVHVTNHGAPVDTAAASGKLTVLAGSAKQEVVLLPAGANRLSGQGSLPAGSKLLISVGWPGKKPLQARASVQ